MQELLDQQDEILRPLRRGETVSGVVMKIDQDGILVSVGHKAEGVVPPQETETLSSEEREALSVGDTLTTWVVEPERGDRPALLSLDRARREEGWEELQRCLETGELLDVPVVGYNRGGLLVDVHGVRGFVPYSQLGARGRNHEDEQGGEEALAGRVGERLSVKVMEVDRRRNRAILSERRALQELRERRKQELLEELEEGQVRRGRVSSIASFGAFVDLGGADGLIHISELAWEPVANVTDVLSEGQEVEVYVLKVDRERGKIGLSLRRLQPEPWETVTERYHVGQLVKGTVTNLTAFGAFARIEGSVEGLIHISELSHKMLHHPKEVVSVGDVLTLKILHIDPERRRMGLSLKEAEGESLEDE